MKNTFRNLVFITLGLVIVASCSVEKRLHNTGYSISWNKNWKHNSTLEQKSDVAKIEKSTLKSEEKSNLNESVLKSDVQSQEVKATPIIAQNNTVKADQEAVASKDNKLVNNKIENETKTTFTKIAKSHNEKAQTTHKDNVKQLNRTTAGGGQSFSGGMLVLMIILCLFPFINLIPVYMHDGSVTLNFWLTLVLDLILIGGIIFALLVVLDVVNLA